MNTISNKRDAVVMNPQTQQEKKQRALEFLILLLLGASDKKVSLLHFEKEVFLLWNFHPDIKDFVTFISHYRGPYSKEIEEIIKNPFYLVDCWRYLPPPRSDTISGGFVELTTGGRERYKTVYAESQKNPKMVTLLAAFKMVREMYDKLSLEELLLLIYDSYPEYRKKSNVYETIHKSRQIIADKLKKKGFIDEERYQTLIASN